MLFKTKTAIRVILASCFVLIGNVSCKFNQNSVKGTAPPLSRALDSLLQYAVSNREIPGAVACVSLNGKIVYHKAHGWRNLEQAVPLEKDDIFRMASMTKGLTAVAVMQLVEQESLDLDDEVSRYIPDFKNPQVLVEILPDSNYISRPAEGDITIRQLLTHTSGIGYGFQNEEYNALIIKNDVSEGFEDDSRTSLENINRLAKLPLLFDPGEHYVYGLSYDVLGVIIEQISGLRFDRYIKQKILDPLQMLDSYFIIPEQFRSQLVSVYQPKADAPGLERASYPDTLYPLIHDKHFFSGGSDLCSTAGDYIRFLLMLLNGGELDGIRILQPGSVESIISKQVPFETGGYDLGFAAWITNEHGAEESPMKAGTFEFGGFFDTQSWADPQNHLVAVLLLQMYPSNEHSIHQKFKHSIYQAIH